MNLLGGGSGPSAAPASIAALTAALPETGESG
jgi:hypothetical protein